MIPILAFLRIISRSRQGGQYIAYMANCFIFQKTLDAHPRSESHNSRHNCWETFPLPLLNIDLRHHKVILLDIEGGGRDANTDEVNCPNSDCEADGRFVSLRG